MGGASATQQKHIKKPPSSEGLPDKETVEKELRNHFLQQIQTVTWSHCRAGKASRETSRGLAAWRSSTWESLPPAHHLRGYLVQGNTVTFTGQL